MFATTPNGVIRGGERKKPWGGNSAVQRGDRHIETFERKKDADARHATVKVNVRQGVHIAPSKSITVAEAAEGWIKRVESEGRERATIREHRQHLDLHILPRIGRVKLANLTPTRVEAFRDDLLAKRSRQLSRKVLISFKSLLKAAKFAHVAAHVSIRTDKRGKRQLEPSVDFPTTGQIKRLIQAAGGALKR